jgi:hypothetical protein
VHFYPRWYVSTYNACLSLALLLSSCSSCGHINQNTEYCPISPCFQHIAPLHAPLPCSLARQPCPAALPCSLARQPCPAALPGSLARQPYHAALPGSLARQPCRNITSLITGCRPAELQAFYGRRPACSIAYFYRFPPAKLIRERG